MDNRLEIAGAFGEQDVHSAAMAAAVEDWFAAYYGGGLLKLPYTVVRKLVRSIFAEYCPEGAFLATLPAQNAMELALIGGESYLSPVFVDGWRWRVIPRTGIFIFARDFAGEPTDVGLTERRFWQKHYYTLLERRTVDRDGYLTVTNRLFRSNSRNALGREVALSACPAFEKLPKEFTYPNAIGSVGLTRLAVPVANCIDGSREGVSIYAPALQVIEAAEENERLLQQEFRNGQSRLVVSRDLLSDGQLKDDLFVALDDSPEAVGITIFAPELRQKSFLERQQSYLRTVESVIGLKRGLLSEVEAADRTATEITSSEGEYMATVLDLRHAFEHAAGSALETAAALGAPQEACRIHWGDGVL